MFKKLAKLSLLVWTLVIGMSMPVCAAGTDNGKSGTAAPALVVESVPAIMEEGTINGRVLADPAIPDADPSDYRISVFLQVSEGDTLFPKPWYSQTYQSLNDDWTFNAIFITGGYDIAAEKLHVMLVPGDYVPEDFDQTKADSLAYVEITRKDGGSIVIDPSAEEVTAAFSEKTASVLPKLSVNAGFYLKGKQPGDDISRDEMNTMLSTAAPYVGMLRFYSCTDPLKNAYELAKEKGIRVVGTAWLSGNDTADRAELDSMIKLANKGYMEVCIVGSETLNRGDLTEEELLDDIAYVKKHLTVSIPVTTADTADMLLKHTKVTDACDVIFANMHPIFAGVKENGLIDYVDSYVTKLQQAAPGKKVWISETGYPTKKKENGKIVDCSAVAAQFAQDLQEYSAEKDVPVLLFELFDESWKGTGTQYSVIEKNWGIFDEDLQPKDCYKELLKKASGKTN